MRRALEGPGVPWWAQIPLFLVVGPWQYQSGTMGGWLGGYYPSHTHPYTHPLYPPGPHPADRHREPAVTGVAVTVGHAHMTVFGGPKEILGVEYAQVHRGHAGDCVATGATLRLQLSSPLPSACSSLNSAYLSISQYISVYLRIP